MDELLRIEGVSKSFGGVAAVRDFNLAVTAGAHVGLIGPNGAGKSTLFGLVSGALRADGGRVVFGGSRVDGLRPDQLAALGISRTFQIARPFPRMSAVENVMSGAMFGGRASPRRARREALDLLGAVSLLEKGESPAGSLTLAEQRRLELARALATHPKLLMVDEAMAGLTPAERGSISDLLAGLASERGLTLIVSEHVMDSVVRLCGRVVVMDRGKKLADGDTESVLKSDLVAEVYMGRRN